jgi:co-chaperonin GroES (HSP10)
VIYFQTVLVIFFTLALLGVILYKNKKLIRESAISDAVEFTVAGVSFRAKGDRIVIVEDPFVSGYECRTCHGPGTLPCNTCDNGRSRVNQEIVCKICLGSMKFTCPDCQGKGVIKGGLVIADKSQRRPTTGKIVSAGAMVGYKLIGDTYQKMESYKIGDRVMYGSFAGHSIDLDDKGKSVVLRILHDTEILSEVAGHLTYRRVDDSEE